jgi:hypothetical protein
MQLLVYSVTLIVIFGLTKAFAPHSPAKRPMAVGR